MNDIAVILSHANTEDKIFLLEETIEHLVKQNKKIIVSSHIDIPNHLYEKVDYVIYDKENPLIRYDEYENQFNIVYVWTSFPQYHQDFPIEFNHAFAVHKLILNACSLAQLNGYDVIHFVNYDYVIKDPNVLAHHNQMLNFYDVYSYDWTGYGANHKENISSAFFSVKIDKFLQKIMTVRSKQDYCQNGNPIYEDFLFSICKDLKIYSQSISEIMKNDNVIAAKSILDDFVINLPDNKSLLLYLSKESQQYYVFISNPHSTKVFLNGISFDTSITSLIAIDENHLINGLEISIPNFDIKRRFTKNTPVARAEIKDRSIINYGFLNNKKKYTIEEYCDPNATKRWDIINHLCQKYQLNNYLEIGVNDGTCIRQIRMSHKDGVDPSPGSEIGGCVVPEINYEITSDDFFNNHAKIQYDIIFIDGLHHSEQVDKDIENSLKFLRQDGFIILHDCNPPEYEIQLVPRQTGIWNGDVWKSIVKLRCQRPDLEVSVIDTDWGIGVVKRGVQNLLPYELNQCLDWNFFDQNRDEILNIISVKKFYENY